MSILFQIVSQTTIKNYSFHKNIQLKQVWAQISACLTCKMHCALSSYAREWLAAAVMLNSQASVSLLNRPAVQPVQFSSVFQIASGLKNIEIMIAIIQTIKQEWLWPFLWTPFGGFWCNAFLHWYIDRVWLNNQLAIYFK